MGGSQKASGGGDSIQRLLMHVSSVCQCLALFSGALATKICPGSSQLLDPRRETKAVRKVWRSVRRPGGTIGLEVAEIVCLRLKNITVIRTDYFLDMGYSHYFQVSQCMPLWSDSLHDFDLIKMGN